MLQLYLGFCAVDACPLVTAASRQAQIYVVMSPPPAFSHDFGKLLKFLELWRSKRLGSSLQNGAGKLKK